MPMRSLTGTRPRVITEPGPEGPGRPSSVPDKEREVVNRNGARPRRAGDGLLRELLVEVGDDAAMEPGPEEPGDEVSSQGGVQVLIVAMEPGPKGREIALENRSS